jgi:mRNA-capping enzyme
MYAYLQRCPAGMALIHCTHGFNRTGYMVASYLVRMFGRTVEKALFEFAQHRKPGIYKHYYIRWEGGAAAGTVGCQQELPRSAVLLLC